MMKEMSKFDEVIIYENNIYERWQQAGKSAYFVKAGTYKDEKDFEEKLKKEGWK